MFQTLRSFQELSAAQTQSLYGPDAAKLYDQASQVNEKARDSYMAAIDTYYKANQQADYGSFIPLCFLPNYDPNTHKKSMEQWDHMYTIPQ